MRLKVMFGLVGLALLLVFVSNAGALTRFPNGVSSYGAPVLPNEDGQIWGTTYFVSASDGSDGDVGTSREVPFATIQKAIDMCTTAKGDRIFVQNGAYAEDLTITKDDVTIIGQSATDVIVTGATDATDVLAITGNEVTIKNLQFDGYDTGSDISLITITSVGGAIIDGCIFVGNEYQIEALTASDTIITGNQFITTDDVTDGICILMYDSNNCKVIGNSFTIDANTDAILHHDNDNMEIAYNSGVGDDDTGASAGSFILINGEDATSQLSVHDNYAALFDGVITEVGSAVAAHGLGTTDIALSESLSMSGNTCARCNLFFDTAE